MALVPRCRTYKTVYSKQKIDRAFPKSLTETLHVHGRLLSVGGNGLPLTGMFLPFDENVMLLRGNEMPIVEVRTTFASAIRASDA